LNSAAPGTTDSIGSADIVGEGRRGDAKGAALRLVDVTVSLGGFPLLSNINWRVEPKSKWALVGANGCGKSTLLKAILNDLSGDSDIGENFLAIDGFITVGTKQKVGYLKQTATGGSTLSVFDEAASAMRDIAIARTKLRLAEQKVASYDSDNYSNDIHSSSNGVGGELEHDLKLLEKAREHYERVGGYVQEKEVTTLLQGLGFTDFSQKCSDLSGGWQMRVSFAKLLLSKPSLCLLDEPSNHLDRSARAWLANYLKNYDAGAMILVTHDVELLNACEHIAEISGDCGSLQVYKSCTHTQYLQQKKDRAIAATTEYEKNMEKVAKLQAFVDKYGASATKASAAQSRVKQIEKMKSAGLLDPPTCSTSKVERFKPRLQLPDPPAPQGTDANDANDNNDGGVLLALRDNAVVGYTTNNGLNDSDSGENSVSLISDIELEIQQGMKVLIRGPNGAGELSYS